MFRLKTTIQQFLSSNLEPNTPRIGCHLKRNILTFSKFCIMIISTVSHFKKAKIPILLPYLNFLIQSLRKFIELLNYFG